MIGAVVKTKGFAKTRKAIARIKASVEQPGGFLGYAGVQGHKEIMKHFSEERGEQGQSWDPLKFRQGKALQDKGRLRASVIWMKLGTSAIRWWALAKYAIYHQEGTKTIPKREFIFLPTGWKKNIVDKFAKYVVKK